MVVIPIGVAVGISIHAPRAGSDFGNITASKTGANFNPRSPCGERRYRHN